MNNIWFTADHHFNHSNVITYSKRPFANVEEMNEELIKKWNEVDKKGDTVYHLGDFSFSKAKQFKDRLNGQIHLIRGNHDRESDEVYRKLFVSVSDIKIFKTFEPHIILCHYALRVWNKCHYGTWHLYGHSHGHLPDYGLSMDVGIDTNNYYPYSYEEIKEKMLQKDVIK